MKMNIDILNVILAVKAYKSFKYADTVARDIILGDLYDDMWKYYCSLPLPDGMKKVTNILIMCAKLWKIGNS